MRKSSPSKHSRMRRITVVGGEKELHSARRVVWDLGLLPPARHSTSPEPHSASCPTGPGSSHVCHVSLAPGPGRHHPAAPALPQGGPSPQARPLPGLPLLTPLHPCSLPGQCLCPAAKHAACARQSCDDRESPSPQRAQHRLQRPGGLRRALVRPRICWTFLQLCLLLGDRKEQIWRLTQGLWDSKPTRGSPWPRARG